MRNRDTEIAEIIKSLFENPVPECARPWAQQCGHPDVAQTIQARPLFHAAVAEDGHTPVKALAAANSPFQTGSKIREGMYKPDQCSEKPTGETRRRKGRRGAQSGKDCGEHTIR